MAGAEIKIDTKGIDSLFKQLQKGLESKASGAAAGFLAGKDKESDGQYIADVAIYNEFGTENIPARPFLRTAQNNAIKRANNLVQNRLSEGTTVDDLCKELGVLLATQIKNEINRGQWTPNASSTVRQKGSSKPLIDTGTMRSSVHTMIIRDGEFQETK